MTEFVFLVEDAPEGGYTARGMGEAIFAEADTIESFHEQVRDAVKCHFDEENCPRVVRLHFVRDEVIAV